MYKEVLLVNELHYLFLNNSFDEIIILVSEKHKFPLNYMIPSLFFV